MYDLSFTKFKRGQVWIVNQDKIQSLNAMRDKNNYITEKTRPWLIVSTDISNKKAPILNCVPIPSTLRSYLPCHINIRLDKGLCAIQCEQITTLNKSYFDDATYIGELNEDMMQKVEVALVNQLGLSIQVPSLETLKTLIEELANAKAEEMRVRNSKITDEYVASIAEKLELIFSMPDSTTIIEKTDEIIKHEEPKPVKDETRKNTSPKKSTKWTEEAMRTFIEDSEKLSTEEMSKKYDMSIKSIYASKYKFKNILNSKQ